MFNRYGFFILFFCCFLGLIPPKHSFAKQTENTLDKSHQNNIILAELEPSPSSPTFIAAPYNPSKQAPSLRSIPLVTENTKPIITVGYEEGMGIIADSTSYNAKGYGYDLLQRFGAYAGIDFEFVEIKGSLEDAVKNGIVDIGGLLSKTDKRKEVLAFGNMPVHFIQYALTTKGDKDYFYDDPQSIDGKTVATFSKSPGNVFLDTYLEKNNISVNYIYDDLRTFDKVDADFYLFPSIKHTNESFHSILNLELRDLFFFTRKGNEDLINYLDGQLYSFFVENASFPQALANKYNQLGNEFQNRALTRQEAEFFKDKTFRVGYLDSHEPYQSKDLMGNPQGIAIEFMNRLAAEYAFNVEYIPFNLEASWSGFEDLDILISLVGERNHIARFYEGTDPYTIVDMNIIYQNNFAQIEENLDSQYGLPENSKVGIINYINFKYGDFFVDYPSTKIMHYTNSSDLIDAFVDKEVDAIIATSLGTSSVAASATASKFQNSLHLPLEVNFQISKKISKDYLRLFNVIINNEATRTINTIVTREVSEFLPTFGTRQFLLINLKYIIAGALAVFSLLFAFILILRQRSAIKIFAKDNITPLKSLSQFTTEVNQSLSKASLNEYEMIILDIDYFRVINNYYGTDKGTKVIQAMANALIDAYKGIDVVMARRIAEQFLIYKKTSEGPEIKEVIKSYVIPRVKSIVGEDYSLKMSIAICKNSEKDELVNELLDNVNIAHQEAKKTHNTSFVEFNESMRQKSSTMLDIIYRMEHALENKEFKMHYQPKIAFDTLKIMGAEALVRWIPPIGNPIYPNDFIPIMEENGFISQLEMYVFEEVCSFIQKNNAILALSKIAINFSPITLSKSTLIKQMIETLNKYEVAPSQIEIEITESAVGAFEEILPKIITVLHKIGFSVAMDDFGAGNSSLNRLSVIEVDVLKLDKVFLDFHVDAPRGSLVVQQVVQLAKELNMKVVAEGVEEIAQAKWLKGINCDFAQGYYFARPIKEEDFLDLIIKNKAFTL